MNVVSTVGTVGAVSTVQSSQQGPGRPRSSSGRALTWDGRNPAVRLPPVLMEELELMSHGVAVVRRKSKVTYADIIAWLLDQCPEQVAQVKAMCPPEVRAKFMPRSDGTIGSPPQQMLTPPPLTAVPAHLTGIPHTTPEGGIDERGGGQVGWLMPPGPHQPIRYGADELVDSQGSQPTILSTPAPQTTPIATQGAALEQPVQTTTHVEGIADPDPEANDVDITIEGDEGDEPVKVAAAVHVEVPKEAEKKDGEKAADESDDVDIVADGKAAPKRKESEGGVEHALPPKKAKVVEITAKEAEDPKTKGKRGKKGEKEGEDASKGGSYTTLLQQNINQ